MSRLSTGFKELRRRNVFRVAAYYIIAAWLIMQVADVMFPALNLPAWTITFVAALLILGLPIALALAWAFDVTPEGIKRAEAVATPDATASSGWRKLDFLIIAVLGVAVAFLLYERSNSIQQTDSSTSAHRYSVAVLPFVNMSGDQDNEYFSDGVSEEILNELVKLKSLRVPSRTSSFAFKGKDVSLLDIARELKVGYVLEGSVRKSGNRVRITAQLIEATSDSHLWSDTFDRELTDIFQIQREISASIARTLQLKLTPENVGADQEDPVGVEAYQHFLEGRYLVLRRGKEGEAGLRQSIELFQQAIDLEPGYARAYAGLGSAHALLTGYSNNAPANSLALAEESIARAIELDPELGEAYATLGLLRAKELKWAEADQALARAVSLSPNDAQAMMWYGMVLTCSGRTSKALEVLLRANDIDPYSPLVAHWLADVYRNLGEYELSRQQAQRSVDLGTQSSAMGLYIYHLLQGDLDRAEKTLKESLEQQGFMSSHVGQVVRAIKDSEYVDVAAEALEQAASQVPENTFWMYFDLPDSDVLFDELLERGPSPLNYYRFWEPEMSALRQHPRFLPAMTEAGLMEYWQSVGWPDLCRPDGDVLKCD
ncbi:MAG: tetratricopeptide repeat protein [Gammaproteobacteria bacterium]|nr:tetratricopeptide repeat protein [Gammaproteobacteria bacterium]